MKKFEEIVQTNPYFVDSFQLVKKVINKGNVFYLLTVEENVVGIQSQFSEGKSNLFIKIPREVVVLENSIRVSVDAEIKYKNIVKDLSKDLVL